MSEFEKWFKDNYERPGETVNLQMKVDMHEGWQAARAQGGGEPDWSESKTPDSEAWKNPLLSKNDRLEIADGAVAWRNEVIANLRKQQGGEAVAEPLGIESAYQYAKNGDYGSNMLISCQLVAEVVDALRAARAQGGEAVAEVLSVDPMKCTAVVRWKPELNGHVPEVIWGIGTKLYTQPSALVPDSRAINLLVRVQRWWHNTDGDMPTSLEQEIAALLATPQPTPNWIACSDRLPKKHHPVIVAYESDDDGEPCLDSGVAALQEDGGWIGLGIFYRPNPVAGTVYQTDLSVKHVVYWKELPAPPEGAE